MAACDDRPNLVERAVLKLGEPQNQARLLQVAWRISLLNDGFGVHYYLKNSFSKFYVT